MKKRLLILSLSAVGALCLTLGITGCASGGNDGSDLTGGNGALQGEVCGEIVGDSYGGQETVESDGLTVGQNVGDQLAHNGSDNGGHGHAHNDNDHGGHGHGHNDNDHGGHSGGQQTGHVHAYGKLIAEKPATCTDEGFKAHYFCAGCQKYFDADKNETSPEELVLAVDPDAHIFGNLIAEKPATCTDGGIKAHYICGACQKYFDGDKKETSPEELKTEAINSKGHILENNQVECKICGERLAYSLKFELNSGAYVLKSGIANDGKIIIPAFYNGLPVNCIGDKAFFGNTSLESITVPDGIISVGDEAFEDCTSLVSVDLGDNSQLNSIGVCAFENCANLAEISIPDSVTSIGYYAFYGCTSLESINFGDNSQLASIGNDAFKECISLESITIPDNVTYIGGWAFADCRAEIKWGNNPSITEIGISAFSLYKGTSITIPDSVISIGDSAFCYCINLKNITIPNSVTYINDGAFGNCTSLESVNFGEDSRLAYIGCIAFESCTSLKSITLPYSLTYIDYKAFLNCTSLTSVIFENSNGWFCTQRAWESSGTDIYGLQDSAQAANYLIGDYLEYFWKRK